jgi:hypothetical protein
VSPYKQLSDDELLDSAARCELLLNQIEVEVDTLDLDVKAGGRKLRKTFRKFGFTGAAAIGGAMTAPMTGAWSLLAAAGPVAVAFLEAREYFRDKQQLTAVQKRLGSLRTEAASARMQLEAIEAELDARTHE